MLSNKLIKWLISYFKTFQQNSIMPTKCSQPFTKSYQIKKKNKK